MAMSVSSGSGNAEVMMDVNTTPLIDVMLVLLILMIMTLPIQTHAVKLDLPQGTPPPPTFEPIVVEIGVDFDGTLTWDGNIVPTRRVLDSYLISAAKTMPQPEVHLKP